MIEYGLPETPMKESEARAEGWRETFGREQTEIDALAALRPEVLDHIVREAITPFYDPSLDRRAAAARREWKERAENALASHPSYATARDRIEASLAAVEEAVAELEFAQGWAMAAIRDVPVPELDLPAPIITGVASSPLFSTATDYVTASLRLVAHKALKLAGDAS
ncbi:MAG: hypothetical protein M3Y41_03625 [Pseudomonadota bacterium]|nr:hypothetical protein [Pseudomonadota bacterium]